MQTYTIHAEVDPTSITPLHEVRDHSKLSALAEAMERDGWQGRPVLAIEVGDETWAITGSHRIAAAREALIDVPVYLIDGDAIDADLVNCDDDDRMAALREIDPVAAAMMYEDL